MCLVWQACLHPRLADIKRYVEKCSKHTHCCTKSSMLDPPQGRTFGFWHVLVNIEHSSEIDAIPYAVAPHCWHQAYRQSQNTFGAYNLSRAIHSVLVAPKVLFSHQPYLHYLERRKRDRLTTPCESTSQPFDPCCTGATIQTNQLATTYSYPDQSLRAWHLRQFPVFNHAVVADPFAKIARCGYDFTGAPSLI